MTKFLVTREVAERLRVDEATVRWWRHVGRGPKSFRLPGSARVLYAVEDVEAYVEAARNASGGDAA